MNRKRGAQLAGQDRKRGVPPHEKPFVNLPRPAGEHGLEPPGYPEEIGLHDMPMTGPQRADSPALEPGKPRTPRLPSRGSLIGGGGIISDAGKRKAERKRSQWPMLVFTLGVLTALLVVPFLVLRPRANIYTLRQFSAAAVTRATIEETVSGSGSVIPRDVVDVISKAAATVQKLEIKEGDDVFAGQVLATLASPDLEKAARDARDALMRAEDELAQTRLQVLQAERDARSKLSTAKANLSELERAVAQSEQLFAVGAEARANVDAARSKLSAAQREISSLERAVRDVRDLGRLKVLAAERAVKNTGDDLTRATSNLKNLQVKAPFAGRVVALNARVGQDIPVSAKLLTLADVSQLIVEANVDATAASRVQPGQPVRVTVGTRVIAGKVSRVASQAVAGVNGATVKVEVRLLFKEKLDSKGNTISAPIRPNSAAALEITVGRKRNVPTLPRGAFITTGGERIAYVISEDGSKARRVEVSFGAVNANLIEVTGGLEVGARVITSSVEAFKDQAEIEVSKGGEVK